MDRERRHFSKAQDRYNLDKRLMNGTPMDDMQDFEGMSALQDVIRPGLVNCGISVTTGDCRMGEARQSDDAR